MSLTAEERKQFGDLASKYGPPSRDNLMAVMHDPDFAALFPHAALAIDFGDGKATHVLAPPPDAAPSTTRYESVTHCDCCGLTLRAGYRRCNTCHWVGVALVAGVLACYVAVAYVVHYVLYNGR